MRYYTRPPIVKSVDRVPPHITDWDFVRVAHNDIDPSKVKYDYGILWKGWQYFIEWYHSYDADDASGYLLYVMAPDDGVLHEEGMIAEDGQITRVASKALYNNPYAAARAAARHATRLRMSNRSRYV